MAAPANARKPRRRRAGTIAWIVSIAVLAAMLGWMTLAAIRETSVVAAPARLSPDDPAVVAEGAAIYRVHCAACHGADLEGEPDWRTPKATGRLPAPPHDATGHTWHHPTRQLLELTKYGVAAVVGDGYESDMPAYEGILSDGEILAVLSFIKSTWPAEVRARHDRLDASAGER